VNPQRQHHPRRRDGFTLIEMLVVLSILAILALFVIPQFLSAVTDSKDNALRTNLFRIRQQIEIYKQEHGQYPSLVLFTEQMTEPTLPDGTIVAPGTSGALGPYLREVPRNPMNDDRTITDGDAGSSGWFYDPATGAFHANDSAESRDY